MATSWPNKDPNEVLDYSLDWTDRLDGDTIQSADWTIVGVDATGAAEEPPELIIDPDHAVPSATSTVATIWLAEGSEGAVYRLTCRVTTAGGRVMDETRRLRIKTR